MLCFEISRELVESRQEIDVNAGTDTISVGNPKVDPCATIVVTGQLDIVITNTEAHVFFYRMQVHLGAANSCALRLTAFSFHAQTDEVSFTWQSIPQSQYTVEVSADMEHWQELKPDIPSQGTSTTETVATA